ncbi:MAG: hypothetical protein NVV60_11830 [Luteimonas sp.]|nr:hypothetical protein [Luteimonas sp.]
MKRFPITLFLLTGCSTSPSLLTSDAANFPLSECAPENIAAVEREVSRLWALVPDVANPELEFTDDDLATAAELGADAGEAAGLLKQLLQRCHVR